MTLHIRQKIWTPPENEQWLEIVTKKYDEIIAANRGYIDSVQVKETAEQYTSNFSKSGLHVTSSKRSSESQREPKLKREELEKHEAAN